MTGRFPWSYSAILLWWILPHLFIVLPTSTLSAGLILCFPLDAEPGKVGESVTAALEVREQCMLSLSSKINGS